MKNTLVSICIILFVGLFNISAQDKTIPFDPNVRFGKLENGLTYYIRHNEFPAERADFYFVQRIGSTVEEENQYGFAHILEHTAFNGTLNFPKNSVRNYLETIGVQNANASTSYDQTIYMIPNAPTTREGIVDSCLLILHDWSSQISLIDEDTEKERSIIQEEWRTRRNASQRINEKLYPIVLAGSSYANHSPIGTTEVIDNFKPAEIRDFYHRWYRPDLQAIIIVGAIDVAKIEAKIKQLFSVIPVASTAIPTSINTSVSNNIEPIVAIVTDPEKVGRNIKILFKYDPVKDESKNTENHIRQSYLSIMAITMMNERLREIQQSSSALFSQSSVRDDKFLVAKTKNAWQITATPKGSLIPSFEALLEEMERVLQFGFTLAEYDRAKANFISKWEVMYNERNTRKNSFFVKEYIENFTDREPFYSIEFRYEFLNKMANLLTVEDVNNYMKIITDSNRVVILTGPDNKEYPTETEILAAMARVKDKELTPYKENLSEEPLISKLPPKGKIISINENGPLGTKELLLSNGVHISLKKTNFKNDQLLFSAFAKGGLSMINEKDLPSANLINSVVPLGGLGNFNTIDLRKKMAGERVSVRFTANLYDQAFSGSSTINDTETLLQLLYLTFTSVRQDEDAYQSFLKRKRNQISNRSNNIVKAFNDSITKARYGNNSYAQPYTLEDLERADYNSIMQLYRENFASDAAAYHFTFVGNIDEDILLPLIEQYIASLPAKKTHKSWRDVGRETRTGEYRVEFKKALQTPKATVYSLWTGNVDYTLRNFVLHPAVVATLKHVYREKIREEEGGAYSVGVKGGLWKIPKAGFYFMFQFDTDAPMVEPLLAIANVEINRLQSESISEEDWSKVRESMLKKHHENLAENGFWLNAIQQYHNNGIDGVTDYVSIVNSITTNEIRDYAHRIFSQKNTIKVIQLPE